ncbi:Ubiquitin carboxyl-terminal hydrolase MINDY-2, partial [Coemansia sp. RSA 1722]
MSEGPSKAPTTPASTKDAAEASKEMTPLEIASTANIEPCKSDQRQYYRLKPIQWTDRQTNTRREVTIVTQNENGPCPLISLANALVLQGRLYLGRQPSISDEELIGHLGNALFSHIDPEVSSTEVDDILGLLPTLTKGLDVEIKFTDVFGFVLGPATNLFRGFNVPLVHGWVVEPDSVGKVIREKCEGTYNGLVNYVFQKDSESQGRVIGSSGDLSGEFGDAVLANLWLESNATQLTEYGIGELLRCLEDYSVAVFFRNNHFSTLYKRPEGLYTLCADDGVAADRRVVWESICDVGQENNKFYDSEFRIWTDSMSDRVDNEEQKQVDGDYAMALELQRKQEEEERKRREARELQVRQMDRMPPGMMSHGALYAVPNSGSRRSTSVGGGGAFENNERRNNVFLPSETPGGGTLPIRRNQRRRQSPANNKKPEE